MIIIVKVTILDNYIPENSITRTIKIGVISTSDQDYEQYKFLANYAEQDLNTICIQKEIDLRFNFSITSGKGDAVTPLSTIWDQWDAEGTELFVAGGWTSQLTAMRSFISDNKILVLSPSSTTSQLSQSDFQREYIYRLSPPDHFYPSILARFSIEYGLERILIIGQEWYIEAIGPNFLDEYEMLGGDVIGNITYLASSREIQGSRYTECLDEAEKVLASYNSRNATGVLLLGFGESGTVISESNDYPLLHNVTWLHLDAYRYTQNTLSELNDTLLNTRIISLHPVLPVSEKSSTINEEFDTMFGEELDFFYANVYDSCMLLGLSVIEADSSNSSIVRDVLPAVAGDYSGLTGPCGLDVNGDRRIFKVGLYILSFDDSDNWQLISYYDST